MDIRGSDVFVRASLGRKSFWGPAYGLTGPKVVVPFSLCESHCLGYYGSIRIYLLTRDRVLMGAHHSVQVSENWKSLPVLFCSYHPSER